MLTDMKNWLIGLMNSAFLGFDDSMMSAVSVLKDGLPKWDEVYGLSETLRLFCYTIIALCMLIELAQVAAKVDIMKWEYALRVGVKTALAKVCIDEAPNFLKACYHQAQAWIDGLSDFQSILGSEVLGKLTEKITETTGFGAILGLFISTFIIVLAIKIAGLLIQLVAYGRMFELYVYLVVSPLPCAFMPLGNGDGSGINRITTKFFKNFIAVCLQGVMMVISIRIFDIVMGEAITKMIDVALKGQDTNRVILELCFTMLLGAIALVQAVSKSGSWAKNIMDAM